MITLKDLFDTMWSITSVSIQAYGHNNKFIHRFVFTDDDPERMPRSFRWDIESGKMTYVNGRINVHGEDTRGGSEMAWGFKSKSIPNVLMDAEIWHLGVTSRYQGKGYDVDIGVYMQELEVETARSEVQNRAYKLTEDNQ